MARTPDASPQTLRVFTALLADVSGWHYGYALSKQTGLVPGTLYPILARLVDRNLLEARWEPSDRPGRPARHVYRLTGDGARLARERIAAAPQATGKRARPAARPAGATGTSFGTAS